MANEITYSVNLQFSKGGITLTRSSGSNQVTVSGDDCLTGTQLIGTSNEVIALVDVGTPGFLMLHNLDSTNYVEYSADGTNYAVRINAGEWALFRCTGSSVNLRANTASCRVEFFLIEN